MMTGMKQEYVKPWRYGRFSFLPLLYFLFPNKFHRIAMFLCRVAYTLHRVRGTYIFLRKDVYYVFVLDTLETSQLFNHCQRQRNGRCLRGMLYILSTPLLCQHKVYFVVIHIGVGYLGVARSDSDRQCEGLEARDE